jgi:hypothetical protein
LFHRGTPLVRGRRLVWLPVLAAHVCYLLPSPILAIGTFATEPLQLVFGHPNGSAEPNNMHPTSSLELLQKLRADGKPFRGGFERE